MHILRRIAHSRPHLASASVIGLAVGVLLPDQWQPVTRLLTGWNIAVWLYLISMGWVMLRASQARVRKIAEQEDKSAIAVLAILSIAATVSLAAIVLELAAVKELTAGERTIRYAFTAATVFGSWCLVGVLFTIHYAHLFYRAPVDQRPLGFPDKEQNPDYWDFLYLSFTIAVAAQTSDVALLSRSMRKTALAQSVLSFVFNVAIVGLSINIAAGLIGT